MDDTLRRAGRPTTYTDELGFALCTLVRQGVPISVARRALSIGKTTLHGWRARGAAGVEPYAAFVGSLERSLAFVEATITANVVHASSKDWRAGAWWLERRRPQRYGAKQTLRVEKAASDMTDAEIHEAIERHGYVRAAESELTDDPDDRTQSP